MSSPNPILIASDHAGMDLKFEIIQNLREWKWEDLGPFAKDSVDYPDYAEALGQRMIQADNLLGVLICGTGIGMSIAANKLSGVRATVVENPFSAQLSREHNHTNVLCLGSRILASEYACVILRKWLTTTPSQNSRHLKRIEKISLLERKELN